MMGADLHHRTQEFRDVVLSVSAGLKSLLGTASDVLILTASGTGAMEASVTNCAFRAAIVSSSAPLVNSASAGWR